MTVRSVLRQTPILVEQELAAFTLDAAGCGAIVTFTGLVRPTNQAGETVTGLFLDHYPGMTERSLETIAQDAAKRFHPGAILVIHRCGQMAAGDTIVFVAVASDHRRTAFEAADYLMDRLKTEAVLWKREDGIDGARWIEPTDNDRADRDRWRD